MRTVRLSSTVARPALQRWRELLLDRFWRAPPSVEPLVPPRPPPPPLCETLPPLSIVTAYDEESVERAVTQLWPRTESQTTRFFGLDTEATPQFSRGAARKRTALLQVSDANSCVVASLHALPLLPPSLQALLADERSIFVGVGVGDDISKLLHDYAVPLAAGGGPRWVDIGVVASLFLHEKPGLKGLSDAFNFPLVKSKSIQLSNWERCVLLARRPLPQPSDAFCPTALRCGRRRSPTLPRTRSCRCGCWSGCTPATARRASLRWRGGRCPSSARARWARSGAGWPGATST